jgi:hypothetical protein
LVGTAFSKNIIPAGDIVPAFFQDILPARGDDI